MSYVNLKRETTDLETLMISHYYLWLAFSTTLRLEDEPRFKMLKRALQASGVL